MKNIASFLIILLSSSSFASELIRLDLARGISIKAPADWINNSPHSLQHETEARHIARKTGAQLDFGNFIEILSIKSPSESSPATLQIKSGPPKEIDVSSLESLVGSTQFKTASRELAEGMLRIFNNLNSSVTNYTELKLIKLSGAPALTMTIEIKTPNSNHITIGVTNIFLDNQELQVITTYLDSTDPQRLSELFGISASITYNSEITTNARSEDEILRNSLKSVYRDYPWLDPYGQNPNEQAILDFDELRARLYKSGNYSESLANLKAAETISSYTYKNENNEIEKSEKEIPPTQNENQEECIFKPVMTKDDREKCGIN